MKYAVIDIGTNSVRLLIAEEHGSALTPIHRALETTRLGAGLMQSGRLSQTGKPATLAAIHTFLSSARQQSVDKTIVFGTSALREATDGQSFVKLLTLHTGLPVIILSAETEATYSYKGAVSSLPQLKDPLIFDLGGGSCELAWYVDDVFHWFSVNLGAVYLSDTFFLHDPPTEDEVNCVKDHVRTVLAGRVPSGVNLAGVGGTVTSLAALAQQLDRYDPERVHGFMLTHKTVKRLLAMLLAVSTKERQVVPSIQKERAAILPAGTVVVDVLLDLCSAPGLTVSEGDLLIGSLYAAIAAT